LLLQECCVGVTDLTRGAVQLRVPGSSDAMTAGLDRLSAGDLGGDTALQDLLFNEPWFVIEGLLWGSIAWAGGVRRSPRRRWWITSALAAVVLLTAVGLLSATGVLGKVIIG
jgi:hypothetical protein